MSTILTSDLLKIVREAGLRALEVRAQGLQSETKLSKEDIVTTGDRAVSDLLQEKLPRLLPGIKVIDEEVAASHSATYEYAAVVDPIDGTTRYFEGSENCAVSVGIVIDGKPAGGVIHQFVGDRLFWAERGAGAFCNGEQLHVSATEKLPGARAIHSVPYKHRVEQYARMERLIAALRSRTQSLDIMGSQVVELMQVAMGKRDFFVMNDTKPWDVAAAVVIVREAGGRVLDMKGAEYIIGEPTIVAANALMDLETLYSVIRETQ
jgi:myo-inositol-1(or 4)-monophosphatase